MSVFTNKAASSREQGGAYTEAILGLLADRDALGVLKGTETALHKLTDGLSAKQLSQREAPDKWSINHVLRHLADSEIVWGWRMRMILAHDRPTITGYDQDLWADRLGYGDADAKDSLGEFGVLRAGNLRLLGRASPGDLERIGVHAERGEESVAHLMRLYAGHDMLHLRQIERIRASV